MSLNGNGLEVQCGSPQCLTNAKTLKIATFLETPQATHCSGMKLLNHTLVVCCGLFLVSGWFRSRSEGFSSSFLFPQNGSEISHKPRKHDNEQLKYDLTVLVYSKFSFSPRTTGYLWKRSLTVIPSSGLHMRMHLLKYRRIPKVTAPVTFEISSPKGPQLSGSSYFRVAVTFGQLKYVSNPFEETHWMR